jgi:hypothetical protein
MIVFQKLQMVLMKRTQLRSYIGNRALLVSLSVTTCFIFHFLKAFSTGDSVCITMAGAQFVCVLYFKYGALMG